MRTITCKELGSVTAISVGTTYNVIDESGSRFTIINDKGVQANYGKNLFHNPVEVQEEQVAVPQVPRRGRPPRAAQAAAAGVQAPPVAVAPPAPRVVESIEVNTSVSSNDGENISFSINFDFGGGLSIRHDTGIIIENRGINASCGIQSISGINTLNSHIISSRTIFERYVAAHSNEMVLSPGISVDELFTEVSKGLVQDLIASFQGEDADTRAGLIIISTTEDAFVNNPSLRIVLNEAASSVTGGIMNPNSRNEIVTWLIPVEA